MRTKRFALHLGETTGVQAGIENKEIDEEGERSYASRNETNRNHRNFPFIAGRDLAPAGGAIRMTFPRMQDNGYIAWIKER
jgi:hypothetical protein